MILPKIFGHRTLVSTNGCFDGLHPGHFFFLGYCSAHGDRLVVGINSDDYIVKHKRDNPIPAQQRKRALLDIGFITKVVVFDEDNPIEFLKREKPDVHCIGMEYKGKAPEEPYCKANGIKVVYVPRIRGWSSSALR